MIRPLTDKDSLQFKKLRLETLKADPKAWLSSFDSEKNFPDFVFTDRINYWTRFTGYGYYGYFENDKLLAYALISPNSWANKKHIVNLSDFVVANGSRRKGIGKALMSALILEIKKDPAVEQMQLFANSDNTNAINFYEKIGFEKVAVIPQSVKNPDGTYQDEFIYTFRI